MPATLRDFKHMLFVWLSKIHMWAMDYILRKFIWFTCVGYISMRTTVALQLYIHEHVI